VLRRPKHSTIEVVAPKEEEEKEDCLLLLAWTSMFISLVQELQVWIAVLSLGKATSYDAVNITFTS
jgi:hypothetical protein